MAGEEKPQPRPSTNGRNRGTTININTADPSDQRRDQSKDQQHADTVDAAPPSVPTEPEKPKLPRHDQPVALPRPDGARETHYLTPLAATCAARFDPNNYDEQPIEHAVFSDARFNQRGCI